VHKNAQKFNLNHKISAKTKATAQILPLVGRVYVLEERAAAFVIKYNLKMYLIFFLRAAGEMVNGVISQAVGLSHNIAAAHAC